MSKETTKETYVHEDVTLVCSSGLKTSKLAVVERGVKIAKGKKIATELDKPINFMCKWSGVLIALLAGIVCALMAVPFIGALVIAFMAGMGSAAGLGSILCHCLLQSSKWSNPHSKVKIKGSKALTDKAQLNCAIGGGTISLFFDPATASKQSWTNHS